MTHAHTDGQTAPVSVPAGAMNGPQSPSQDGEKSNIFGSFWVDDSEFALPVSAIKEVVNEPENISSIPLSPSFMLGLFNLRGMIIPIVDLRTLFEFPELDNASPTSDVRRKVAIIENGDKCIGILFDRSGEVLNETGAARVEFRANDGGIKDVVINGVLKLENGDRMVQVLDPYEMLSIERVPKADHPGLNRRQDGDFGKRHNCISFQLGHTTCAIDLRFVQEVRDMPKVDESLLSHGFVIGTSNLRGAIIPIVDFRSFIGNEPAVQPGKVSLSSRKLLVMKSPGGFIGLMVFSIDSILPYFASDVLPFAKLALPRADIVRGCLVQEENQLVMLLDHEKLLSDPGLSEPARTCQEVHASQDADASDQKGKTVSERRTFIIFSISNSFAMDTCDVVEVINKPDDLLEPPYTLEFVEGILNLRSELITVINLRLLYGLPVCEKNGQKVLIFKHTGQKYGMLVDTVDEIVMTTSDKVRPAGTGDRLDAIRGSSEDVAGILQISRGEDDPSAYVVLNANSLVERCLSACV